MRIPFVKHGVTFRLATLQGVRQSSNRIASCLQKRVTMKRRLIAVQPIRQEKREYAESARGDLAAVSAADVVVASPIDLPSDAYDRDRGQYRAGDLLEALAIRHDPRWSRLLGVANVDLYAPGLNFVFGEADPTRGLAVFFIARLLSDKRPGASSDDVRQRIATEAIHELGHTYGLRHCADRHCVMWFSNTLAQTDRKGTSFCAVHHAQLMARLA